MMQEIMLPDMVVEGLEMALLELPTESLRKVPSLGNISTASSSTSSYPSVDCNTPISSNTPIPGIDTDNEHETDSDDDHKTGMIESRRRSSLRGVRKHVLTRRRRIAVTNFLKSTASSKDVVTETEPEVAITYKARNLLDLFGNVRDPRWNYSPTVLHLNNLNQFFENRSLFHRLSKYGTEDLGMYKHKCRLCEFISYTESDI